MENNRREQNNNLQNILEKIQKNELVARPKKYFRLKITGLITIALATLVISIFLFSFILFDLRVSGQISLIGFGSNGFTLFLLLFPWKLLLFDLVLIFFLGWFLRTFRFGYKTPVLYLLVGVLTSIIVVGFIVDNNTSFHDYLLHEADQHLLLPIINDFYEQVRMPPPREYGIYRGTITAIGTDTLRVNLDNPMGTGTVTPIQVLTPISEGTSSAEIGERIFITGEIINGQIHAVLFKNTNESDIYSPQ